MPQENPLREKIMKRMKTTKSNRYNQSARLYGKSLNKSIVINIFNIVTIFVGVYLVAVGVDVSPASARLLGVLTIGVSLISILISQEGSVVDLTKKASDAHRCGREISHIYRELEAEKIELREASIEYEKIISKYDENHDECDYRKTIIQYKSEMTKEYEEMGVNWMNSIMLSCMSKYSPMIWAAIGILIMIVSYFGLSDL